MVTSVFLLPKFTLEQTLEHYLASSLTSCRDVVSVDALVLLVPYDTSIFTLALKQITVQPLKESGRGNPKWSLGGRVLPVLVPLQHLVPCAQHVMCMYIPAVWTCSRKIMVKW